MTKNGNPFDSTAFSDLEDIDRNHILHGFTAMKDHESHFMHAGTGSWVEDIHGKKYLDFKSCAFNVNLGYQHSRLVNTLKEQAEQLCYTDFATVPSALATQEILEILDSKDHRIFYSTSGSSAVETGLKIARDVTKRQKIVSYFRNFHGATYGAMSVTGSGYLSSTFGPMLSHHLKVPPAYCHRCYFGTQYPDCDFQCVEYVEAVLREENPYSIAAIIAEPIVWSDIIMPPPGYWNRIKEICNTYDILLMFDEIVTGFGRTGRWFAYEEYDVIPDILISGKGLTAGILPLFVTIVNKRISDYYTDHMFFHGFTFQGYPLACAVAAEVIKTIKREDILQNVAENGTYLHNALRTLEEKHEVISDVRGIGLMQGVEVAPKHSSSPLAVQAFTREIMKEAFCRGLIIGSYIYNFLVVMPPLVVSKEEIDAGINILDETLNCVSAQEP
jgi:taurine--2-oxoglutarate transaminase